jgi:tetratricopeptide (TPR) repeat protein
MWEYKGTFNVDVGKSFGILEYDFFSLTNTENDFKSLTEYYISLLSRFKYNFFGYSTFKDNKDLSPNVKSAMKENTANCCLTLLEELHPIKGVKIRTLIVNVQTPNSTYEISTFDFLYFPINGTKNFIETAEIFRKNGIFRASIMYYTEAIKLEPENAYLLNYRGSAYNMIHDYNSAIKDLTRSINIAPKWSSSYAFRGYAYARKNDYDNDKSDLSMALELEPGNEFAKEALKMIGEEEVMQNDVKLLA